MDYFTRSKAPKNMKQVIEDISPSINKKDEADNTMMYNNIVRNMSSKVIGTDEKKINERVFWINIGVGSDHTYVEKLMSTSVVADYIYRLVMIHEKGHVDYQQFIKQNMNIVHPFSVLIDPDYNILRLSKYIRTQIKKTYDHLQDMIQHNFGCKMDKYKTFSKKFHESRKIIHALANMLKDNKVVSSCCLL